MIATNTLFPLTNVDNVVDFDAAGASFVISTDGSALVSLASYNTAYLPAMGEFLTPTGTQVEADPLAGVSVRFDSVTSAGTTTVVTARVPTDGLPSHFWVGSQSYDVKTTATFTGAVTVCFEGAFDASSRMLHFDTALQTYVDVTTQQSEWEICGRVTSLSPFVVGVLGNARPLPDAGASQIVEATSATGAIVSLDGAGTDPDDDPLTFTWTESGVVIGTSAHLEVPLSLGVHTIVLSVDDGHGGTALAATHVTVQDTTPPTLVFSAPVPPPNGAGWNRTDVSFAFAASDTGSGVASTSPASPLVVTGSGVGLTGNVVVSDNAGNSATFTSPPVNIDRVAPALTPPAGITVPQTTAAGAVVTYAAPVIVETGSGLASSACAPASGSTFPIGVTTVTCTAADIAGNSGSATFTVTVTATTAPPAPNGLMFGVGFINDGHQHDHFIFLVSQLRGHDSGALEFWLNDPTRCGLDDDYSDAAHFNGDNADNYGRSHHNPTAHFEASSITDVTFSDDPAVQPGRSLTGTPAVDTVRFTGVGKWNGRTGYRFEATASDHGEPGRGRDTFSIIIRDSSGAVVASVNGVIDQGNVESLLVP